MSRDCPTAGELREALAGLMAQADRIAATDVPAAATLVAYAARLTAAPADHPPALDREAIYAARRQQIAAAQRRPTHER